MARQLSRLTGTGSGGNYNPANTDRATRSGFFQPAKDITDLIMLGVLGRNRYAGGSDTQGIGATAVADFDLLPRIPPFVVDNSSSQFSNFTDANGATLVVQVRFLLRVSDAAVSVTPKIYNETDVEFATVSGNSACSATNADYSGTGQQQTLILTLPAGVKSFRPVVSIAGTVAAGHQVWASAILDIYIQS